MITKEQALKVNVFHDDAAVDPDSGRCIIWRRAGETVTWELKPEAFSTPVANDAGVFGAVTEMDNLLFHAEDDCPHGYRHDVAPAAPPLVLSAFTDSQLNDIPDGLPLQNGQQDHVHRVLRRQLDDKLDEIAAALGLTDLQMMEVVVHWMQHKVRDLRDAEVESR